MRIAAVLFFFNSYAMAGEIQGAVEHAVEAPFVQNDVPRVTPSKTPKLCREGGQRGQNIPLFSRKTPLEAEIQTNYQALTAVDLGTLSSDVKDTFSKLDRSVLEKLLTNLEQGVGPQAKESAIISKARGFGAKVLKKYLGTAGQFTFQTGDGSVSVAATYYKRGWTRQAHCEVPPLKIRVDSSMKLFDHSHSVLKFVTQCKDEWGVKKDPSQKVLAEYALYQIIQASGLPAFDTRLVKTKHRNSDGSLRGESWGFFIEDEADMARRYGAEATSWSKSKPYTSITASTLGSLLVNDLGDHNHDNHNYAVIRRADGIYDVPYDMDCNPLVAGYVCKRGFTGMSTDLFESQLGGSPEYKGKANRAEIANTLALMKSNKEKIYEVLKKVPFKSKDPYYTRIKWWLDQFFSSTDQYLETNKALVKDFKVKEESTPTLWFQMSCDEQKEKSVKLPK